MGEDGIHGITAVGIVRGTRVGTALGFMAVGTVRGITADGTDRDIGVGLIHSTADGTEEEAIIMEVIKEATTATADKATLWEAVAVLLPIILLPVQVTATVALQRLALQHGRGVLR